MKFKVTNALRIISIIILVVVFFIAYAGLPEQVLIMLDSASNPSNYIDKDYFFYGTLGVLILANTLLYILATMLSKTASPISKVSSVYVNMLSIIVNIFFSVSLSFIGILNGQENFDYSSFAPFIYASQALFVVWAIAFIISIIKSKKSV